MNQQVTQYIEKINEVWQKEICTKIRQTIHMAIPNITEQVKYNQAFYALEDKQVCVFFPAKNWVNITIFNARMVEAPEGYFEPSDNPERRAIKIRAGQAFDFDILSRCLKQITHSE